MTTHQAETLYWYLVGCPTIGLPLAIISVLFYKWAEDFDDHPAKPFLKLIRNILHPGSFLFLPRWERDRPRDNDRDSYEGPINLILDGDGWREPIEPHRILFYLILASLGWPIRVLISAVASGMFLGGFIIMCPFAAIFFLCKFACKPFTKKTES